MHEEFPLTKGDSLRSSPALVDLSPPSLPSPNIDNSGGSEQQPTGDLSGSEYGDFASGASSEMLPDAPFSAPSRFPRGREPKTKKSSSNHPPGPSSLPVASESRAALPAAMPAPEIPRELLELDSLPPPPAWYRQYVFRQFVRYHRPDNGFA